MPLSLALGWLTANLGTVLHVRGEAGRAGEGRAGQGEGMGGVPAGLGCWPL